MTTVSAADGCRLAVHEVGEGPPLLCVPGGPGRAAEYLEDLGGLAGTRQLLLLDNRGTGGSELPEDRSSLQLPRLADDLEDVRRALELAPADVLGHSAGCPVVLLHAARHPDAVRRLVLVTPSGRPFGWAADDVDEIRASRAGEPWFAEAAEAQQAMEHANPRMRSELEKETRPFWYGRWDDRAQQHAAGADRQMSLRANAGYPPGPDYDPLAARESLRTVRADVLVVVGELDALTGAAVAKSFADELPSAEVTTIAGAGHFPWVDEPAAFRAAVESFLAR
ncbi:MAG TPA: alpha/beta hydrolase [Mycobacteriales bacterium]|nr:alpha/beta hydrolase [Mycobacteriales bacterium]